MADTEDAGKGDGCCCSTMDVDQPMVEVVKKAATEKAEEEDFLVLEEDDGGDEAEKEAFLTPEAGPMDANKDEKERTGGTTSDKKTDDEILLLVNPLFGKDTVRPPPVIDIESSSSSSEDDEDDEDFSLDVSVNNFVQPGGAEGEYGITTIDDQGEVNIKQERTAGSGLSQLTRRTNGHGCNCDCYHEKGILVNEIERLRSAIFELSERHSVLEDFIEVEYSESFDKFLKNREHLVSMGFGGKDSEGSVDIIDGKRSAKSAELIELLKMIKEQARAKIKEESDTKKKPSASSSSQSNKSHSPKPKSIPSVSSQRERDRGSGRGGALSYNQRPVIVPAVGVAPNVAAAYAMNYQYQQQLIAAQQGAQARHYHENMYGHRDSRDFVSAVGRTELYPSSSSSTNYGYGGYGGGGRSENKESKRQRKRKRHSAEVSSEASSVGVAGSSSSKNTPSGKGHQQQQKSGSSNKKSTHVDIENAEVIDYSQDLSVNTKRICPLCEKIINRKQLRDHLSIVHQGHKVTCPVCQVEFMQRKRIKTHMRDSHDLPVSEYTSYIEKIYNNIEEQCGPWLDKLMKEADTPTKDQVLVHNAEIQMQMLARREKKAAAGGGDVGTEGVTSTTTMKPPVSRPVEASSSRGSGGHHSSFSSGGGSGRRGNRDRDRDGMRDKGSSSRGGSSSYSFSRAQQQPVRYFTGANAKIASTSSKRHGGGGRGPPTSEELYGPGGYAQYAAKYLQQRAASGTATNGSRIYTPF